MKYYQCLTCRVLFPHLFKIDKHLQICGGTNTTSQCRGRRPIATVRFADCYIPIVRNQIDPEFLKLYDGVEAKSDDEIDPIPDNESPGVTPNNDLRATHSISRKWNRNRRRNKSSVLLKCTDCAEEFHVKRHLELHVKTIHRPELTTRHCIFCGKSYINLRDLDLHLRGHIGERPFACRICHSEFNSKENRRTHEAIHNPNRELSFECKICNKKFFTQANLYQHHLYHEGYKPFKCPICDKGFSSRRNRTWHMETHKTERDRPFLCDMHECGKAFHSKNSLARHMKSHVNLKLKCKLCHKSYRSRDGLMKHSRLHEKNRKRKYKCKVCSKSYYNNYTLKIHMITHSGKRPHKCSYCNKSFSFRSNVKRHQALMHEGLKPIQCSGCGDRFGLKQNWIRHTQIHKKCSKASLVRVGELKECGEISDEEEKLKVTSRNIKKEMEEIYEDNISSSSFLNDTVMMVTDVKIEFPTLKMSISQGDHSVEILVPSVKFLNQAEFFLGK